MSKLFDFPLKITLAPWIICFSDSFNFSLFVFNRYIHTSHIFNSCFNIPKILKSSPGVFNFASNLNTALIFAQHLELKKSSAREHFHNIFFFRCVLLSSKASISFEDSVQYLFSSRIFQSQKRVASRNFSSKIWIDNKKEKYLQVSSLFEITSNQFLELDVLT